MKRLLMILVVSAIGMTATWAQKYDLNGDGIVNSGDVVSLYNYIINGGDDEVTDQVFTVNGVSFKMIGVEGGSFYMGTHSWISEKNHPQVSLSNYSIGETVVTQALWKAVMGKTPTDDESQWDEWHGLGDNYPAYYVSYEDALEFIAKLNTLTGKTFRLPTEAEWEFAAIGGKYTHDFTVSGSDNIYDVAWFEKNSGVDHGNGIVDLGLHPVKEKNANELKIYDMSGNIWEMCYDWYEELPEGPLVNPNGPTHGVWRVMKGGCCGSEAKRCESSSRSYTTPTTRVDFQGFRLAM